MTHTMTARRTIGLTLAAAPFLMAGAAVHAQAPAAPGGGIYSCVDAQGRRITADRPIAACIDRPQSELNRSGTTVRVIPPSPTATEREAQQAREREAVLERQRARDALRRDQGLVNRYPNTAAHEADRKKALEQTQGVIDTAQKRIDELQADRKVLDEEMEFYRKNPAKAPAHVRRAIEDNEQGQQEQRRAIASQQEEQDRINARYDAEAAHLKTLWAGMSAPPPARGASRP